MVMNRDRMTRVHLERDHGWDDIPDRVWDGHDDKIDAHEVDHDISDSYAGTAHDNDRRRHVRRHTHGREQGGR